jgi:pimeloyl-ACP methyl ester carboxylesterase
VPRLGKLLGYALAGLLFVESGAQKGIALAVVMAPNALRSPQREPAFPMPPELERRAATRFELGVGPPSARLVSWLIEPPSVPARGTIVLLHGIRMDRRSLVNLGVVLSDAGYRAALVDLRGHGESSGRYLTYGEVETRDLSTLLDALENRGPLGCVGVYGFSYGAAVALELGARDARVQAVVAAAPFASLREVVLDYRDRYLPFPLRSIPDAWFERAVDQASQFALFDPDRSAPIQAISRSHAHQLLIHGTRDDQVPLRHSRELARAAGPLAQFITIEGASHANLPFEAVSRAALAWFGQWLAPSACGAPE